MTPRSFRPACSRSVSPLAPLRSKSPRRVVLDITGGVAQVPIRFEGLKTPLGFKLHEEVDGKPTSTPSAKPTISRSTCPPTANHNPAGYLKRMKSLLTALLLTASLLPSAVGETTLQHLRCEYLTDPLGIDVSQPRLSWEFESRAKNPERGVRQSAYQILAASSEELLRKGQADLWDSGKVVSDDTAQVIYGGKPLTSGAPVFWKVRAWDQNDQPTTWSEPAKWSMGLLKDSHWKAQWMTEPWQKAFVQMVRDTERLGMDVKLGIGPGWCGSGGPWIKPENAMQHLVFSSVDFKGPQKISQKLPAVPGDDV